MSSKTKEASAQNQEQNNNSAPKKTKAPKKPSITSSLGFSPIALAMFEIQRREVEGNVISGLSCILIGLITAIFSIVKCRSGLKNITVDADKILAYAWMVYAVTGTVIILIGVYEILKSFISMEQIRRWTKTAESHVTPMQEMNSMEEEQRRQEQGDTPLAVTGEATEPALEKDSGKKRFAFLEKKDEKKDENKDENKDEKKDDNKGEKKYAPAPAAPVGFDEARQRALAGDLPDNNANNAGNNNTADANTAANDGSFVSFAPLQQNNSEDDFDGFFMGEVPANDRGRAPEPIKPPAVPKAGSQPVPTVQPPAVPKAGSQPVPTVQPPAVPKAGSQPAVPTVQPPAVPQGAQQQMPSMQALNSMQPPAYGAQNMQMPYFPGGFVQQPVQNMYQALPDLQGMMPGQGNFVSSPFGYVGAFGGSDGAYNPAMPPYTMHPFRPAQQNAGVPQEQAYNSAMPPYTMHPFRPAQQSAGAPQEQAYNSAMPPYTMHPFRPSAQQENAQNQAPEGAAYNSAMPPYTMHPFRPSAQQENAQNQAPEGAAYNSAMPPYTVHAFKPSSAEIAAPTMAGDQTKAAPAQDQASSVGAYNSAMPPYTVHAFKSATAEIAAPTMAGAAEQPQMPTAPNQPSSGGTYNSAMPPYTVHAFKTADPAQQPIQPQLAESQPAPNFGGVPSANLSKSQPEQPANKPSTTQLGYGFSLFEELNGTPSENK